VNGTGEKPLPCACFSLEENGGELARSRVTLKQTGELFPDSYDAGTLTEQISDQIHAPPAPSSRFCSVLHHHHQLPPVAKSSIFRPFAAGIVVALATSQQEYKSATKPSREASMEAAMRGEKKRGLTTRSVKRLRIPSLCLALLLGQVGCSHVSPMPEHVRAGLGVVAVVAPPAPPESTFGYPVPSRAGASLAGASAGLGVGVLAGAGCFVLAPIFELALAPCAIAIWTPVMLVTGGVEGAVKGVPISEVWRSARALKDAVGEPRVPRVLAERVTAEASRRIGDGRARFAAGAPPEGKSKRPRYRALAADGVDTVLEVRVERLDLERIKFFGLSESYGWSFSIENLIDAPLTLAVEGRGRVLRASDGRTLYESAVTQRAGSRKFTEWGREGAAEFRRERDRLLEALAEDIANAMFGPAPSPPESAPPAPAPDQ